MRQKHWQILCTQQHMTDYWQVGLAESHRHARGREDAQLSWALTLPEPGLANNTRQIVRHSEADVYFHDKLASATKKRYVPWFIGQAYLLKMTCFACISFESIAGKPKLSFWTLLLSNSAEKVGFRAANFKGRIALLKTAKDIARTCWLSGQVGVFGTSRSLQGLIKVSSEVEFYVYNQDRV